MRCCGGGSGGRLALRMLDGEFRDRPVDLRQLRGGRNVSAGHGDESGAADARRDLLAGRERHHAVIARVYDERRRFDEREQRPHIDLHHRLEGVVRPGGEPLVRREQLRGDGRIVVHEEVGQ